jgi:hypothetical protein
VADATMPGDRVPCIGEYATPGDVPVKVHEMTPGQYALVLLTTPERHWEVWFRDPAGMAGRVREPIHTITPEPDGTVTVSPSILDSNGEGGDRWHGFLEHGVWRTV